MDVSFTVWGDPVPQGRPRFARIKSKDGREFVSTYDPKKSKSWKETVKWQAIEQKANRILPGALHMTLSFFLARPKSLPKKVVFCIKKPDLDNLVKGVKDALSGICYERDQQIVVLNASKEYVPEGVAPHTIVTIKQLEDI